METPDNPMTITVLMRVEGLTEARFRQFLQDTWLAWPRFRQLPQFRGTGWWWEEDPVFSLKHHLQVVPDAFNDTQLQNWISNCLSQRLPDYRPRWKFWLLPQAQGCPALLFRIHHCYADGVSLVSLFEQLCTQTPDCTPALPDVDEPSAAQRWREAGLQWIQSHLTLPDDDGSAVGAARRQAERVAMTGLRLVHEVTQYLLEPEDSPTSLRQALSGRRRCHWSPVVPLTDFQRVAARTGCKVNDVILACVAAAMREHLGRDGQLGEELTLHAAMPVDIRNLLPDNLQPRPGELGNLFGTVFVPLPVDADTPLERLYRIKHETRRLKHSWQPGISWGLICAAGVLPRTWQQALAELFTRKASAVVSNVPGTPEPRYLAGCRVREQMFWVPQSGGIGLGISVVSYAGGVQFGVVADEAILPEPAPFLEACLRALDAWQ